MKILYIANEFRDVQVAAKALRGISPDVTVLWGYSADRAAFWIRENPDLAALIVEVQADSQGRELLKRARSFGLNAPIVAVLPEGATPPRESLEAGADDYVAKNQSFSRELPAIVSRTIERAQTVSAAPWDLLSESGAANTVWSPGTREPRLGNLDGTSIHQHQPSRAVEQSTAVEREEDLEALIDRERAARADLEHKLELSVAALQDAERREAKLSSTLAEAAERQAAIQAQFEQEVEKRRSAEEFLAHARTAHEDAEKRHASSMTIAATTLAERQTQFEAELSQTAATRDDIRQQLSDAQAALGDARQTLAPQVAEIERLTQREAELTSMLADAAATRDSIERRIADTEARLARSETARDDAETRHEAAMATAAALFAERQAQLDADLAEEATARTTLLQEARDLEAALKGAEQILASHAAEAERLTRRDAELTSVLADATASRNALEGRLAEIEAAFRNAEERAAQDRLTAAETATEREADLDERIRQEHVTRALVEQKLAHVETAWRDAEEEHASALTSAAATIAERQAQFEMELSQTIAVRDDLSRQLSDVERNLEETRRDFQRTLDILSNEYAEAQATLVASLSERDARLEEQTRHVASLHAAELGRSKLQDDLQATLAARQHEIEEIQKTLKATALELVSARTRCESMQASVPPLQRQLDESRLETRRQFHRTPVALGRCTRDGALTHFNRAFVDLVGYRNPNELRGADFARTIFESPDDLSWLIERCVSTHAKESIETTWKNRHGERVVVRLSALESAPNLIEIAAEDITDLHVLKDRLGRAHRMEAVGRLASEIAVTCGNLLKDVHEDAQQWLTTVGDNAALRQRGERLLEEVTRATGLLQKLGAYSDEQASAFENVDLNKMLRDLKPVLKHLAGDDVVLELPKVPSPLHIDVKAERVERLLVNLASYGRERMPSGGRLKFELASVVVNQRFLAQYPSVRPGAHALITVTEVRRTGVASGANGASPEKSGVDLGALQEFIRECGGHLWMAVAPAGNMVMKIHLPLRTTNDQAQTRGPGLWAIGSGLWARVRGSSGSG